jgi:hypothetical protein
MNLVDLIADFVDLSYLFFGKNDGEKPQKRGGVIEESNFVMWLVAMILFA